MQLIRIKSIEITYLWSSCYFSSRSMSPQKLARFTLSGEPLVDYGGFLSAGVPNADGKQFRQRPGRRHRRIISAGRSPVQGSKEFDVEPGRSILLPSFFLSS